LNQALELAGIDRGDTYVTNVVKHFKWEAKGKRRLHKKPNAREIGACLPWLEAEIDLLRPEVVVCLGATATQALLGNGVHVLQARGKPLPSPFSAYAMTTVHPSSIVRLPSSADRLQEVRRLADDLRTAATLLHTGTSRAGR